MILVVRRTNLLLVVLMCVLSYMTFNLYLDDSVPTFSLPVSNRVVIIDAGHGSPDGGAVGPSGVLEKDINLAIAMKLQALIEQSGGIAVLTREGDNSIHDDDKITIREKKRSDLKNRKEIINSGVVDAVISIHLNKFEQSKYYGAQTFFASSNPNSKTLAERIQKELIDFIDNNNNREIKPIPNNIYLFKQVSAPTVMVECGFLSNPEEERLLQTDGYQKKLAWAIYVGIMKYFNT